MSGDPDARAWSDRDVVVTGGAGFLGKPVVRMLEVLGAKVRVVRTAEHDLRESAACRAALRDAEVVIHLAANVGGIGYNRRHPGALIHDNIAIGSNVFEACRELGVSKLVAACSVCAYPKLAAVPFREERIWDGYPEESSAPYGLAKRMLLVYSDAYRREHGLDSCVPLLTNLYGPGDNFDLEDSHVVAALIRRYVEAADSGEGEVSVWGTGEPTREFLHVDDAARALLLAAERCDSPEPLNIGTGRETRIRDLAQLIAELAGFEGETVWDSSRPDGQPRRCLDVTRAREAIGFEARVELGEGLERTLEWYRSHRAQPAPSG